MIQCDGSSGRRSIAINLIKMKKHVKNAAIVVLFLAVLGYFLPYVCAAFILLGLYDVLRNTRRDSSVLLQYFTGNGVLTWALSPFNTVMDILTLPYLNKGIYTLSDLPKAYQDEIRSLIDTAYQQKLVERLEPHTKDKPRTMIFFKWYGSNINTPVDVPEYHCPYKYIRTIGVSVFNRRESTSRHFGPMRATLRVLYNLNDMEDNSAYIEVGKVKQYWREEKLFIFDDTLLHQSFNESDKARYCLFVDILRPSLMPPLMSGIVTVIRTFLKSVNFIFYKNWEVIKS